MSITNYCFFYRQVTLESNVALNDNGEEKGKNGIQSANQS